MPRTSSSTARREAWNRGTHRSRRRSGLRTLVGGAVPILAVTAGSLALLFRFGVFDDRRPAPASVVLEIEQAPAFPSPEPEPVTVADFPMLEPPEPPDVLPARLAPVAVPSPAPPAEPRRMPLAGMPGYTVVVMPDGASYLEDPAGRRTRLADAEDGPADGAPGPAVDRLASRLSRRAERKLEDGVLVVLDRGVVDIPKDAIITFQGADYLVIRDGAGGFWTYHADGRVARREPGKETTP